MKQLQDRNLFQRVQTIVCLAVLCVTGSTCSAADWMFQRSYYSHTLPQEMQAVSPKPHSRTAYREAVMGDTPGFALRGVSRWKWTRMQSGSSIDTTLYRSNFAEEQP